jgi:hypothetical protein
MFGGVLEWRPRPTPGCSAIEEEEVFILIGNECDTHWTGHWPGFGAGLRAEAKRGISLTFMRMEWRYLGRPTGKQVTIETELSTAIENMW